MTCSAPCQAEAAFFHSRAGLVLPPEPERQPVASRHPQAPPLPAGRRLEKEIPIILPPAVLDVYEVSGQARIGILADGNPVINTDPFGLWSWMQTTGVMRGIGGGLEAFGGYGLAGGSAAFGAAASWTGVGVTDFFLIVLLAELLS
ncbi:MAG TPA: hypothetical protein VG167_09440 [Verrucomicrobiae bacterium]|nr:hypothetical protein [Verrucomicrobiae bacterium]